MTNPSPYRPAKSVWQEAKLLVLLGTPVAITQVSILTMGLVDTWMVGRLGPVELAAVALGDACFFTLLVMAIGIVSALDPLISQAHGANDPARCGRAWRAGLRISIALTLPMALMVFAMRPLLGQLGGLDPQVVQTTMDYLAPRTLGILPQLWYVANRSLFNGLGATRPPMIVGIAANLLNVVLDWMFIFGNWGAPALGVAGSGLATAACRWFMFLGLWVWLRWTPRYRPYVRGTGTGPGLIRTAFRLGLPIGLAQGVEVGAFAAASLFMGWMGVVPLASHQIAIKMAATSFMVAVALGVATGIRVGNAIGAGHPEAAQRSAWVGVGLGFLFMAVAGLGFVFGGEAIVKTFTTDPGVIELGAALLVVAAAFQLSDGAQAICAGALRGAGDTVRPLIAQIVAHWAIGLPIGYLLAFRLGYGPTAVWWALAAGLTAAAVLLGWRVRRLKDIAPIPD